MSHTNPAEVAKQFAFIAGGLSFLVMFLPMLFKGIPPFDSLLLAILGSSVMGMLGWKFGMIWATPLEERSVIGSESTGATAKVAQASLQARQQENQAEAMGALTSSESGTTPSNPADTPEVPLPPTTTEATEAASTHSWNVDGTGQSDSASQRQKEA
jgi:hypothetical protein